AAAATNVSGTLTVTSGQLNVNAAQPLSVTGTTTVTGTLDINTGTMNVGNIAGGGTVQFSGAGGTLNISGNNTTTSTFTSGTSGTVNYNRNDGTGQTVRPTTYRNLTISGSGTKTMASGTTTVSS